MEFMRVMKEIAKLLVLPIVGTASITDLSLKKERPKSQVVAKLRYTALVKKQRSMKHQVLIG